MENRTVKLLVADDEENVRKGIVTYIRKNSRRIGTVLEAEDGRQALELIILHKPELVLMDVRMPYKSGLEVIREAGRAGVQPKCVILSGHDEFKYAQQAVRLGAADYLLKPCLPVEMLAKLEALLNVAAPTVPEASAPAPAVGNRIVQVAVRYIEEHYMEEGLSLAQVAAYAEITPPYLSTLFAAEMGCGFSDYVTGIRIERACDLLQTPGIKTYEVAYKVGYRDEKYFTKVFKKIKGVSPSQYRKGAPE